MVAVALAAFYRATVQEDCREANGQKKAGIQICPAPSVDRWESSFRISPSYLFIFHCHATLKSLRRLKQIQQSFDRSDMQNAHLRREVLIPHAREESSKRCGISHRCLAGEEHTGRGSPHPQDRTIVHRERLQCGQHPFKPMSFHSLVTRRHSQGGIGFGSAHNPA
jgi:hypothetical protein